MKKLSVFTLIIIAGVSLSGCGKSYLDINSPNPNSATSATPELVLPNAMTVTASGQVTNPAIATTSVYQRMDRLLGAQRKLCSKWHGCSFLFSDHTVLRMHTGSERTEIWKTITMLRLLPKHKRNHFMWRLPKR